MWEFFIVTKNKIHINKLQKSLKPTINKLGGVCSVLNLEEDYKLMLAIKNQHKSQIIKLLDETIASFIVGVIKEDYLRKNLTLKKAKDLEFKAFLKALTYFDNEYDKQFIKRKLCYNNEIYFESFINFKLNDLKQKWSEVCSLTNENSTFLNSEDTFFELLKFLISNLKTKHAVVNVVYNKKNYKFLNDKKQELISQLEKEKSDANLITSLISLAPAKINVITDGSLTLDTIDLINKLFKGKVHLKKE